MSCVAHGHTPSMLALLLRLTDQRSHGRRCRWCGIGVARKGTCSADCRAQLSAYWELGN